jgi:GNAT superfamily N-acetyltransferase
MSIEYRNLNLEQDAAAVAAIVTRTSNHPLAAESFEHGVRCWRPENPVLRQVAVVDGQVVGYLRVGLDTDNPKNAFLLTIVVDHPFQRRGIGSHLFELTTEFVDDHRPGALLAILAGPEPVCMRFAEKRQFVKVAELFDSYLDLELFDLDLHLKAIRAAENAGYRITTLAEFDLNEETRRAFYEQFAKADKDTPGQELYGTEPWEAFDALVFGSKTFNPQATAVAMKGDQFVGFSTIHKSTAAEEGEMFTGFTGVVPEERGKGLAYAVKVKGIEYCLSQGGKRIKTENDTRNQPMLAVNRKLGFEPQDGELVYVRELDW